MWHYRCALVRVTDGDGVLVDVDLGFYITHRVHLRLFGIDCPELNARDPEERVRARLAKERLQELLPLQFLVRTAKPSGSTDKYGRWLGQIELGDGRTASEVLLAEGHARPYLP